MIVWSSNYLSPPGDTWANEHTSLFCISFATMLMKSDFWDQCICLFLYLPIMVLISVKLPFISMFLLPFYLPAKSTKPIFFSRFTPYKIKLPCRKVLQYSHWRCTLFSSNHPDLPLPPKNYNYLISKDNTESQKVCVRKHFNPVHQS